MTGDRGPLVAKVGMGVVLAPNAMGYGALFVGADWYRLDEWVSCVTTSGKPVAARAIYIVAVLPA